jgi:hypothetical protein
MNPPNDLDINRHIRKTFVKHWIDLGKLSIRTTKGKIAIHGYLDRIAGSQERLSSSVVDAMFDEIERINGVERLIIELSNWVNSEGRWQPIERGKKISPADSRTPEARQTSYDIKQ